MLGFQENIKIIYPSLLCKCSPSSIYFLFCILRTITLYVDPLSEERSSSVYVPRDECFSDEKQLAFSAKIGFSTSHALLLSLETTSDFPYDSLFNDGINLPQPKNQDKGIVNTLITGILKFISDTGDRLLRFKTPETMDSEKTYT